MWVAAALFLHLKTKMMDGGGMSLVGSAQYSTAQYSIAVGESD